MKADLIKGNDIDFATMSKAKSAPVSVKEKTTGSVDGLNAFCCPSRLQQFLSLAEAR